MRPTTNCIHKKGKGAWRIPKNMSLINLIPAAAKKPGISNIIKAKILVIVIIQSNKKVLHIKNDKPRMIFVKISINV